MTRCKNILIALDQLINTLFKGWPDETFSSRCWRWHLSGKRSWPRTLVDALFFWDKNHCKSSYESEMCRNQLPASMRGHP